METKRCAYCHRLQRADTKVCRQCGRAFIQKRRASGGSRPTVPPASPHRAGHYSGLHPEDQPYQSNKITVQRAAERDAAQWRAPQAEPEHIRLPTIHAVAAPEEYHTIQASEEAPITDRNGIVPPTLLARPKSLLPARAIPVLLALSCIFFLLASSILAFTLMGHSPTHALQPTLTVTPDTLRVNDTFTLTGRGFSTQSLITFTVDLDASIPDGNGRPLQVHADRTGAFSIQAQVPADWKRGTHHLYATDQAQKLSISTQLTVQEPPVTPPKLQLSTSSMTFGEDDADTSEHKTLTLRNSGGGQVNWQSSSNQTWLTVKPASGTFSGTQNVEININRGELKPKSYSGRITFTQQDQDEENALVLTVQMTVKAQPATLYISPTTLNYSTVQGELPNAKTVVIQNSGGQRLDWTSTTLTDDGAPWLSIDPAEGHLDPNTSAIITINAQSQQLTSGSYQGSIKFNGVVSGEVGVTLAVITPGNLTISTEMLAFKTVAGQQAAAQNLTLENTGGQSLDWSLATDNAKWLQATPDSGTLPVGQKADISVNTDSSGLAAGEYKGTLKITTGKQVKQVAVTLTVSAPPTPAINVQPASLQFTTKQGKNPAAQSFSIQNSGNAPLRWTITTQGTAVGLSQSSGTIEPGKSVVIAITPNVARSLPGNYSSTVVVGEDKAGSQVDSQKISLTTVVSK